MKVAFQAGVLQVWLDEAGLEFDRGDAVSAACCSNRTPRFSVTLLRILKSSCTKALAVGARYW